MRIVHSVTGDKDVFTISGSSNKERRALRRFRYDISQGHAPQYKGRGSNNLDETVSVRYSLNSKAYTFGGKDKTSKDALHVWRNIEYLGLAKGKFVLEDESEGRNLKLVLAFDSSGSSQAQRDLLEKYRSNTVELEDVKRYLLSLVPQGSAVLFKKGNELV